MTKGHSTARTRAWQVKNHTEASGEVFPPLLAENQPSDRAFNTLATILQAALVIAQAEHSQTSTLLYSASRWVKDCFEWHQEAVQDRDTAHCLLQAKQHEFEVIYSELAQCREALTLFQQQLSQHAHRHIRTIQAKPDGDLDHFKSVTISLQAQLTRREENIADLRRANAKLKQEIAQARTDMELALEIATTQLEAEVHRLEQPVRAQAANTKVRVLPILRSSPSRIFKAWAERAIFQGQQHIVARRQDLDLTVCAMRAWKRVIFLPRWPRSQKAYHMRLQNELDLASCAWRSWTLATFLPRMPRSQKAYHMRLQNELDLASCAWRSWTLAAFQLVPICGWAEEPTVTVQLPAVSRGVSHAAGFLGGGQF